MDGGCQVFYMYKRLFICAPASWGVRLAFSMGVGRLKLLMLSWVGCMVLKDGKDRRIIG